MKLFLTISIVVLVYDRKMSMARRGRGKSKRIDRIVGEGTSRAPPEPVNQGGAEPEMASQASSTLPFSEESRGRKLPVEPPANTTD